MSEPKSSKKDYLHALSELVDAICAGSYEDPGHDKIYTAIRHAKNIILFEKELDSRKVARILDTYPTSTEDYKMNTAMTAAELEDFRALTQLGESAAALFTMMCGKEATVVAPGKVEIEFKYDGVMVHGTTNKLVVGAEYLIVHMNSFMVGVRP